MKQQILGLTDLHSIIAEMRVPLLEIKLLSEAGRTKLSSEVARQTLALFNSFLYVQKLEQCNRDDFLKMFSPYSLAVATEDVLHQVAPLAQLYDIKLEFEASKKANASFIKQAFDHATHSLLHSLISNLQNVQGSSLRVKISHRGLPSLKFFSQDMNIAYPNQSSRAKYRLNSETSGLGSGLLLANLIYRYMGSKLCLISNQYGRGLGVDFKTTRQMSLIELLP